MGLISVQRVDDDIVVLLLHNVNPDWGIHGQHDSLERHISPGHSWFGIVWYGRDVAPGIQGWPILSDYSYDLPSLLWPGVSVCGAFHVEISNLQN